MWLLRAVLGALALLSIAIALAPEPPASPMHGVQTHVVVGQTQTAPLAEVTDLDAALRPGTPRDSVIYRSWSPAGVRPLALEMGPLEPADYVGVLYQGTIREYETRNALYLRCSTHERIKPIAGGGTAGTYTETIVPLGDKWCAGGEVYLRLVGTSDFRNVGVAQPYAVSALSYLKQSYLGYVGFFLTAFAIVLAPFFAGGLVARATRSGVDPVLGGFLGLGAACLTLFYLYAWTPLPPRGGLLPVMALIGVAVGACWKAPDLARSVWRAQRIPVYVWFLTGFVALTVLHLGATGSGAWEPAHRFAPAIWSSDHLLPGMFAEAVRLGTHQLVTMPGDWSLSDRPPLMAGGYLLFADVFALLQANNDGPHLQPVALAVGGVTLTSLWAAALYWAARRAGKLSPAIAAIGVLLVALTPFALFNTGYTWPKLMGAAFSIAATGYAFRLRPSPRASVGETATFGGLAGFAMLCHAASSFFLAPAALVYFATRLWRSPKALVAGAAVGLALLASWSAYKASALPSQDPLLAYALTGDLHLAPKESLPERLAARYQSFTVLQWLQTKAEIAAYVFTPNPPQGPEPLARPIVPGEIDVAGQLRRWDFYALSAGNLSLLLLGALGVWSFARPRAERPPQAAMAARLLASAAGCYALFVGVTFLALFVHQFSYDAVLALALAGIVAAGAMPWGRSLLLALAAATGLYTGVVWIAAPLSSLVTLDLAALGTLALVGIGVGLALSRGGAAPRGRTALLGLGLAVSVGGCLMLRPGAVVRELSPPDLTYMAELVANPAVDPARCRGNLDGTVARKVGGWRMFGWAWDAAAGAPVKSIAVLDNGLLLGMAATGQARPDVPKGLPTVTDPGVGWHLDLKKRPAHPQIVATLTDGSICALSAAS
ncbi:MAG: hypothetical protein C0481_08175 [Phenylobacterium sp.]|nr:hypothetical protein [Phenylobacterium sp.]